MFAPKTVRKVVGLIGVVGLFAAAGSASALTGAHDLSAEGYGGAQSTEKCVFCHTPHAGNSSFSEALSKDLRVMDGTALALCRENNIPVCIFNLFEDQSLKLPVGHLRSLPSPCCSRCCCQHHRH